MEDTFSCPHCGAPVSQTARFCRECGADEAVGWDADGPNADDDWADDDFDYNEYLRREFPDQAEPDPKRAMFVAVVVLILLSLLLAL